MMTSPSSVKPYYELEDFVQSLEKPRKIFLMVTAGKPVDSVIDSLVPLLEEGDVIMDGGHIVVLYLHSGSCRRP